MKYDERANNMQKNPMSEIILDRLAAGVSVQELKARYGLSKKDLVTAALYGVSQLREEYIAILTKRKNSR